MSRIAIFGGTAEGRMLTEQLADFGFSVCVFVATAYGEDLIKPRGGVSVRQGRLNNSEMAEVLKNESFDAVVDATHPYAVQATENLVFAVHGADLLYIRVTREQKNFGGVIETESIGSAVALLNRMKGKALLTTGSKQLEAFTHVEDFQSRLYARVLPCADVVRRCEELGFHDRNLICMQGPFTHEINAAMIRMLDIGIVVTKESGDAGGFSEKLSAARECGATVIVIRRPADIKEAESVSAEAALVIIKNHFNPQSPEHNKGGSL